MFDIASVGECLIDFTPAGRDEAGMLRFSRNPGGAPANVLSAAAKLGARTAFLGKVGNDDFGRFLKSELERGGINTDGLLLSEEYLTSLAFVQLGEGGERSFSFYRRHGADVFFREKDIKSEIAEGCRIFHFGSVSLSAEPCRSATLCAVKKAKRSGALISFDPNYRPPLWESENKALAEIRSALPFADIVKVSGEELSLITGAEGPRRGAEIIAGYGPCLVLVTLGSEGAYFYNGTYDGHAPAFNVKAIDTTGAGDAFLGAFLFKIKSITKSKLSRLTERELFSLAAFSNAAAGLSTTKKGAAPSLPALHEIESLLKISK